MMIIDTLRKDSQKVTSGKAGCWQSAVSNHIDDKLTEGNSAGGKGAQG